LTDDQVIEKFRENAALAGGSFGALEEAVLELEGHDDVRAVLALLSGQAVAA
jgi:hypothetical protein